MVTASGTGPDSARLMSLRSRRPMVDLALRLNVLAVCVAIVFVSAVLLGAF
jgi:hypothetical protein